MIPIITPPPADSYEAKQPDSAGCAGTACWPLEYQPETWAMLKDTIYAASSALKVGLENTQELLIRHDAELGRMTRSNRHTAERLESEISDMKTALEKLRQPDGAFPANAKAVARQPGANSNNTKNL